VIPAGDIVLTVPHTFIATTEAIPKQEHVRISWMWNARRFTMDPLKLRQVHGTKCELDSRTGRYVHRTLGKL